MEFDSPEQERKRKAGENNEEASPRDRTSPLRDDFLMIMAKARWMIAE